MASLARAIITGEGGLMVGAIEMTERRFSDAFEDRRRHGAAASGDAPVRRIDHHDDRQRRLARRTKPTKETL